MLSNASQMPCMVYNIDRHLVARYNALSQPYRSAKALRAVSIAPPFLSFFPLAFNSALLGSTSSVRLGSRYHS